MKILEDFDYILSVGTFFEDETLKNSLIKACEKGASFTYMHPIDKFDLKNFYTQFIKYEVGSEEAILALILNFFTKTDVPNIKDFLENLDLGYLSAESSAGEEEFEEALLKYQEAKNKALIIGNDFIKHKREENIIKLLANIKKYSDFELVFLNKDLEKLVSSSDLNLDEVDDLNSFNGTLLYFLNQKNSDILKVSQTFTNIAKVKDNDKVKIKVDNQDLEKIVKIDEKLLGTIALVEDFSLSYRFSKVIVEKV